MKRLLLLVLSGLVFLGVSGCSDQSQSADYARICVDKETNLRVEGDNCGSNDSQAASGYLWWYIVYGHLLPAYGYPVTAGYRTVRSSSIIEHDESYAPKGGSSYKSANTRAYSSGSGKKLGTTKGGTGYKAPAVKPAPAPKVNNGGGAKPAAPAPKAPVVKAPAPAPRPVAPAPRPAPRIGK